MTDPEWMAVLGLSLAVVQWLTLASFAAAFLGERKIKAGMWGLLHYGLTFGGVVWMAPLVVGGAWHGWLAGYLGGVLVLLVWFALRFHRPSASEG